MGHLTRYANSKLKLLALGRDRWRRKRNRPWENSGDWFTWDDAQDYLSGQVDLAKDLDLQAMRKRRSLR
jgi:hypothetical protein